MNLREMWSEQDFTTAIPEKGFFPWILRVHWRWILGGIVSGIATYVIWMIGPFAIGRAVDAAVVRDDLSEGALWIGAIVLLGLLKGVANGVRHWTSDMGAALIGYRARLLLYWSALSLDLTASRKQARGDLLSRMTVETYNLSWVVSLVGHLVASVVSTAFIFAVLLDLNPALALIAAPVVLLAGIAYQLLMGRVRAMSASVQERNATLSAALEESLDGVEVIKTLGAEQQRLNDLEAASESLRNEAAALERLTGFMQSLAVLIPSLAAGAGLYIGGRLVVDGSLTIGELTTFVVWMAELAYLSSGMLGEIQGIVRQNVSAATIERFLSQRSSLTTPETPNPMPEAPHLRLQDVWYGDGLRSLVAGIDLEVPYRSRLAIVGPTGSGKSTLAALLGRFVDPTAGAVEVGGADARSLAVDDLRRTIGVMFDEAIVFSGTIAENVDAGRGLDESEVWAALKAAGLADFVTGLPDGLATGVGPAGRDLSGGQRQRLALARVLAGRPRVLVLDEPTSALDESTEHTVVGALEEWPGTVVMITHRLGAIRVADEVVLMQEGRPVARGRHQDLVAAVPAYRETLGLAADGSRERND